MLKDWKNSDINVESLWLLDSRGKSGKHSNVYHGNFIPQIPNQLIRRYTGEGETVLEIFSGSGTTLFECETLNRNYIGFDINSEIINSVLQQMENVKNIHFSLNSCDVTNNSAFDIAAKKIIKSHGINSAQFLIAHPPYMDIVKFTELEGDLSNIADLDLFLEKLVSSFCNALAFLDKERYFAVVIGDVYKKSEVVPLGFYVW